MREVQRRHREVRLPLRDDVVGQLEHDPQPLEQLVGGVHRGGLIVAAGQKHRHAVQVDPLEHEAVGLEAGEAGELLLVGCGGQRIGLRSAQHDERLSGRQLVGGDDRQLGAGELLEMSRKLAGEPAGELAGVGSDDDRRFGLASLGQHRLLGGRRCRRHRDGGADEQVNRSES